MEDTFLSIDVYKESGEIYVDDLYLISNIGKDNDKLDSLIFMLNKSGNLWNEHITLHIYSINM